MLTPTKTGSGGRLPQRRLAQALAVGAVLAAVAAAPRLARAAEVEFYAAADRDEIGVDDTVRLTVTIASASGGGPEALTLPDSPEFRVLSKSESQQMSFSLGGGGSTLRRTRTIILTLAPNRAGTFTLTPGRLVLRGKTYETGALKIRVLAAGAGGARAQRRGGAVAPAPGGGLDADPDDRVDPFFSGARPTNEADLYLRTHLDKKQVYLGEQATMSTYLFARAGVEVSGVEGYKAPQLDGFWSEDIEAPTQINGELKVIDGISYRVFLLRKRALFPLSAGKVDIAPVEVDVSTGFGILFSPHKVHRASQPLALEVLPLPPGAPTGFAAPNVGDWHLTTEATATSTQVGQPVTLKVVLEGTGNLKNLAPPALPALRGLKAYDPTLSEKVSPSRTVYGGRKVAEYLLMPEQAGELTIPALSFAYFDPEARAYKTATSEPITLHVAASGSGPAVAAGGAAGAAEARGLNRLEAGELHPLRYKGAVERQSPAVFARGWFVPAALSPFLLWAGLGLMRLARRSARPSASARARRAAARTRDRLRKADVLITRQPDLFYAEVSRTLLDYVGERLGAPVVGLARPALLGRLTAAGLTGGAAAELQDLLDLCDAGRFAPGGGTAEAMRKIRTEAQRLVDALETAPLCGTQPEVSA